MNNILGDELRFIAFFYFIRNMVCYYIWMLAFG